jgi:L-ribulokinase
VGDIFAWCVEHAVPPAYHDKAWRRGITLRELLSAEAVQRRRHGRLGLDGSQAHGSNAMVRAGRRFGVLTTTDAATRSGLMSAGGRGPPRPLGAGDH